jgi:hypothetical protein
MAQGGLIMLPAILGVARHLLTFGAGYLVARGFIDESTAEALVGAVLTLIGVGWSIYDKQTRA